jgi:hypothetical protein
MTRLTDDEAAMLEIIARAMCETMGDDPDPAEPEDGPGWEAYATHAYNALASLENAGFIFVPEVVQ